MAASKAQLKAQQKYDKEHTKTFLMKLNKKTDSDIIDKLDNVGNKQGYIKSLIREDLKQK